MIRLCETKVEFFSDSVRIYISLSLVYWKTFPFLLRNFVGVFTFGQAIIISGVF